MRIIILSITYILFIFTILFGQHGIDTLSNKNMGDTIINSYCDSIDHHFQNINHQNKNSIQLSNYVWDWKPYINKLKIKLINAWKAPKVYLKGKSSGYTIVRFEIYRSGELKQIKVLEHSGDMQLQESSVEVVKSLFPFLPLPDEYPDSILTITSKLIYPDINILK